MALKEILVMKTRGKLNRKLWVCKRCLTVLLTAGLLRQCFIVPIGPTEAKCDVCSVERAEYFIGPTDQGVYVCSACLEERTSTRMAWQKLKRTGEQGTCDLCRERTGEKLVWV